MSVEATIVNAWRGLDVRGHGVVKSERRQLDVPRSMTNMLVDERGCLYMPPASAEQFHTFAGDATIRSVRYVEDPRGVLVQMTDGKLYFVKGFTGRDFDAAAGLQLLTTFSAGGGDWPIWTLSADGYSFVGWGSRGSGAAASQTFRLISDGAGGATITDISASSPLTSYSEFYKGRRFTVYTGSTVQYSALNDHENFPADNTFTIAGDDGGISWDNYKGFVQGMTAYEDVLIIFMTGSVWSLSGGGPESWQLRQVTTTVGNSAAGALVRTEKGIMSYGGENAADTGVYLFSGQRAQRVSAPIDPLIPINSGVDYFGAKAYGYYILSNFNASAPITRQTFLYDLERGNWTVFSGWTPAAFPCPTPAGLVIGSASSLVINRRAFKHFPRQKGTGATLTLGYHDEGQMHDMVRFHALKLTAKAVGEPITLSVTATLPGGQASSTPAPVTLTADKYDTYVLPINLRGPALELTLSLVVNENDDDTTSCLIESLQLVHSSKGQKFQQSYDD